jgi:hypothetical protein
MSEIKLASAFLRAALLAEELELTFPEALKKLLFVLYSFPVQGFTYSVSPSGNFEDPQEYTKVNIIAVSMIFFIMIKF